MPGLRDQSCQPRTGAALTRERAQALLGQLDGWALNDGATSIERQFRFNDYHETIAFVNALAQVVHREDHHPELVVGYNRCAVRFSTHSVKGLSENDFICAAKIDALAAR